MKTTEMTMRNNSEVIVAVTTVELSCLVASLFRRLNMETHTTPVSGRATARFRFWRVDVCCFLGAMVGLRASRLTSAAEAFLLMPLVRANASAPDAIPDVRLL
jgi:hypothetical protein